MVCPKCGGEQEVKTGVQPLNPMVMRGILRAVEVKLHACKKCGYIEFYMKR